MITIKEKKNKFNRACPAKGGGFALLFAIMVSSIVFSITIGIINIALKEINFSTSAKDANDAFFAADVGAECALFYDIGKGMTTTPESTPDLVSAFGVPSTEVFTNCGGVAVDLNIRSGPDSTDPWIFAIDGLGDTQKSCALVTVYRYGDELEFTTITSKGYNIGQNTGGQYCFSSNPNRVERQLEVTY